MNLSELLSTTPEDLAVKQLEALKADTIARLRAVAELIKEGNYEGIEALCGYSASGDGYGDDNHYIMFHYGDIMETVDKLKRLSKSADGL